MVGLGAPYWDAAARGAITGLGRHHTAAHLAQACLDSIAFQVADVFFAMEEATGLQFKELRADGGATRNARLMQRQADVLGRPVERSRNEELSALGAAWLAGLQLDWWKPGEIQGMVERGDRFDPNVSDVERHSFYVGWTRAVAKTRNSGEAKL
jgi:glycerol kinase